MALSACTEEHALLRLARETITAELRDSPPPMLPPELDYSEVSGVFVTLKRGGALRGCIGSLELSAPLAETVCDCALGAAFRDPRFRPLAEPELHDLEVSISLLTAAEPMRVADRADLLRQLEPGVDGLLLVEGRMRATFLPQVWEQLPEPEEFVARLLEKAGLPGDYWSTRLSCSRYRSINLG